MSSIRDILREEFSLQELLDYIAILARFNRIQGSEELEHAIEFVKKELETSSILSVHEYKFSYSEAHGLHYPIAGWNVKYGEVRLVKPISKLLHTYYNSRSVVVAHSPPGIVEAPVVYVGEGIKEEHFKGKDVDGKIVLAYGSPYIVYRLGIEHGAKGFMFFRRNAPDNAVPYLGLFLTPEEAKKFNAPAVSISRRNAFEIVKRLERGEEVIAKIFVDSRFRESAYIRVVEARLGNGDRELHICAHICHPGGTVNDNVSGAASILELAKTFSRAISKNKLPMPRKRSIVFVWFPEYYGSLPYLLAKDVTKIEFCVNLDMIGERQCITDSTLQLIRSPMIISSPYEALVFRELLDELSCHSTFSIPRKILSYRVDLVPYERGSDHDIYLQFSIPSIMLNQWPDKYYHTDHDTIDKFDPEIAMRISIAVGAALYTIANGDIDEKTLQALSELYSELAKNYEMIRSHSIESIHKRLEALKRVEHSNYDGRRLKYVGPKGMISQRKLFNELPRTKFYELLKILEDRGKSTIFLSYIQLLLMHKPMTVDELRDFIVAEYGIEIDINEINKILEVLKELKLVEELG